MPRVLSLLLLLRFFAIAFASSLLAGAVGCGGARGRGSFEQNVYRDGPIAFELPAPPSTWRRIEATGASLAFRDESHEASVLVNARCTKADDGTPLSALTNHLLIGSTERQFTSQAVEPFDRREALHTRVRAKWDGVAMLLDAFVMKKDGCVYDLVYVAPEARFEEGAGVFEAFARGLRTLPGSGIVG